MQCLPGFSLTSKFFWQEQPQLCLPCKSFTFDSILVLSAGIKSVLRAHTSSHDCCRLHGLCPQLETGTKQGTKTQTLSHEWAITPQHRSLSAPCYPSGQCLDEIWDERKNYHIPALTTSPILFVVTQKKMVRIPSPVTCLQPFYTLSSQSSPRFLFCFYYLLLLQFCSI